MNKGYYIRYERMGGDWYYMIYKIYKFLWFEQHLFFERWNTPQSATKRLEEL